MLNSLAADASITDNITGAYRSSVPDIEAHDFLLRQ
jgi:hypothetical protein